MLVLIFSLHIVYFIQKELYKLSRYNKHGQTKCFFCEEIRLAKCSAMYNANNCKLLVSCHTKYIMRAGGYYLLYLSFNIRDIKESPSTPNSIFSDSGEITLRLVVIWKIWLRFNNILTSRRLDSKCCRPLMFPRGTCHAHPSHKQAENGTSIISPGATMAPDTIHLLTCVKITSDKVTC